MAHPEYLALGAGPIARAVAYGHCSRMHHPPLVADEKKGVRFIFPMFRVASVAGRAVGR